MMNRMETPEPLHCLKNINNDRDVPVFGNIFCIFARTFK